MATAPQDTVVRARFTATTAPGLDAPYSAIQAKIHYPARYSGDDVERLTGVVPPDETSAPWPVVILIHGVNVGPEAYRWLVERIVPAGFAVVTYTMVGELYPPGTYGLTPGVDLAAVRPGTFGSRPSCTAVAPLLAHLSGDDAPLPGLLDLDRVVLGGHSAGGTMAMQNARRDLFPTVAACFSYAGHTLASTNLGWDTDTPLPLDPAVPALIMGGSRDGIIARSADRYGRDAHREDPIRRTFAEGIAGSPGHAYLAIVDGANHQTVAHPHDATVARGFLDLEPTIDEDRARDLIASLTISFLRHHVLHQPGAGDDLTRALASDALAWRDHR